MVSSRHIALSVTALSAFISLHSGPTCADPQPAIPAAAQPAERDGQHDFDFNFGVWKTRIKRLRQPLSGSSEAVELEGTVTVRKVWGGRAQLEEIEADGPTGHWQGMTLFLYNPQAHQWNQTFYDSTTVDANASAQPMVGAFHDGRGELFGQDTVNGRSVLAHGVWSEITPTSHRYEESLSADGGKTWELAFSANLTKLAEAPPEPSQVTTRSSGAGAGTGQDSSDREPQARHAFDFDFGRWKTHSSRLLHPLTGSTQWADMDGHTTVTRIWGGQGNLAEYEATGPAGHVELLALRLYNPTTHQWYLNFAHPSDGTLGVPALGDLRDGRISFYDQEPVKGKAVLVRFSIWGITGETGQSEQAFSTDGGKTWEVNWVNRYSRER